MQKILNELTYTAFIRQVPDIMSTQQMFIIVIVVAVFIIIHVI